MFYCFCFLGGVMMLLYSYYNFLLLLLLMELLMLFLYTYLTVNSLVKLFPFTFIMMFACFMVLEAVLGLSLLMVNYRYSGVSYFYSW